MYCIVLYCIVLHCIVLHCTSFRYLGALWALLNVDVIILKESRFFKYF